MEKLYKNKDWLYERYWIDKLSMPEIAMICKVHFRTIWTAMVVFGIKRRTVKEGKNNENRDKLYKNKDWLYEKYWIEKLSIQRIAQICETCPATIWNYMKQFGINCRNHKEAMNISAVKQILREASLKQWDDPVFRMNQSQKLQKQWQDPDFRTKHCQLLQELGQDPVRQTLQSQRMKKKFEDPVYRANHIRRMKKVGQDPNYKTERRKMAKKYWQDPEYVQKQMKARGVKPNGAEKSLNRLLQKLLPDEYKYVGDGQLIIAGKCPDFININGQKKIIEFFGNYWHRNDDPQERINLFKQYGYRTLIIWEKELKNIERLKWEILRFHVS